MRIRIAMTAAAALAAALLPSDAALPPDGTLSPSHQMVTWEGTVPGGQINPTLILTPAPQVRCLVASCDEFRVTVDLGPGFWESNGDGAVEVAIRWPYDGVIDLDLQVLNASGGIVASSAAVDSNAESVFLPNAANGVYTARVIPSNTFNPDNQVDAVGYEGLVQVETLASDPPGQGHAMLPNLRPAPPANFHIASALNLIPFPENKLLPCYPEETLQNPSHPTRCLRFDQTIANIGEGPLVLRFGLHRTVTPGNEDNLIVQRIRTSDGSYEDVVSNETFVFHPVHGHFHYRGFGQSILYGWDEVNGRSESPVKIGKKVGFCVIDVLLLDEYWGQTGNGPRGRTFPLDCNVPEDIDPLGPEIWVQQGVEVGWADVYGWNLADQFVDITGVPDGTYELVQIANPTHSVIEQTEADNCTSTVISLSGDTATAVAPGTAIPCPA